MPTLYDISRLFGCCCYRWEDQRELPRLVVVGAPEEWYEPKSVIRQRNEEKMRGRPAPATTRVSYPSLIEIFRNLQFPQRELLARMCSSVEAMHRRLGFHFPFFQSSGVQIGIALQSKTPLVRILFYPDLKVELKKKRNSKIEVMWKNKVHGYPARRVLDTEESFEALAKSLLLFYLDRKDVRMDVIYAKGPVISALTELRFPISVRQFHADVSGRIEDVEKLLRNVRVSGEFSEFELTFEYKEEDLKTVLKTAFNPPPHPNFKLKLKLSECFLPNFEQTLRRDLSPLNLQKAHVMIQNNKYWALKWSVANQDVFIYCPRFNYEGTQFVTEEAVEKSNKKTLTLADY